MTNRMYILSVCAALDYKKKELIELYRDFALAKGYKSITHYLRKNREKELSTVESARDIFTVLVMGFTGKEALRWKVAYMRAFNRLLELYLSPNNKEDLIKFQEDKIRMVDSFAKESNINGIPKTKLIKAHWRSDKNHPIAKQLKCFNEVFKQEYKNVLLGDYFRVDVDKAGLALLEMGYTSYSRLLNEQKLLQEGF